MLYCFIPFHTVSIALTINEIKHKDLLKKIRNYEGILTSAKLRPLEFFVPTPLHV